MISKYAMTGITPPLEILNHLVWERDGGCCILCGSPDIAGTPFKKGAHHIFSRGAHPELLLECRNACLLCIRCHQNANTRKMIRKLLFILRLLHDYDYSGLPYAGYCDGSRAEPDWRENP